MLTHVHQATTLGVFEGFTLFIVYDCFAYVIPLYHHSLCVSFMRVVDTAAVLRVSQTAPVIPVARAPC